MRNYIFLLACLFSTSMLYAQSTSSDQAEGKCFKKYTCDKSFKKRCSTKTKRAQSTNTTFSEQALAKKWKVNAVGLNIGSFGDHYRDMTAEGMLSMAINFDKQIDLDGYHLVYGGSNVSIEGGTIGAFISLSPRTRDKSSFNFNQELRLGANLNINREAMIEYHNSPSRGYTGGNSIVYCVIENELTLSGAYLFRKRFSKRLSIYGGAGLNLGSTFDNAFLLIESDNTSFDTETTEVAAKSSYYTRGFGQVGLTYHTLGHVAFNLDLQTGMGMQIVNGAQNNLISETCVVQMGAQYSFLRN